MSPVAIVLLLMALVLGGMAFRLLLFDFGLHWGVCGALAAIPLLATFFMGIIGLLASAIFVGGLYKAAGRFGR